MYRPGQNKCARINGPVQDKFERKTVLVQDKCGRENGSVKHKCGRDGPGSCGVMNPAALLLNYGVGKCQVKQRGTESWPHSFLKENKLIHRF